MARQDILLDQDGDLLIQDGDFVLGESDQQHVELIMTATKGSFLQHPTLGVNIASFINKQNTELSELRRSVEVNLKADGYKVNEFLFNPDFSFNIDYENE